MSIKHKLRLIVEAIAATVAASLAMVTPVSAVENINAPRATFTAQHYTALPGRMPELVETQAKIAHLRAMGDTEQADELHAWMCENLMRPGWRDVSKNLVTTVGKNDLLTQYLKGSAYTAAWYCGLISSVSYTAVNVADTMASHAGWTEAGPTNAPNYSSGTRVALTFGTASAGALATSSASSFTFSGGGTIKGMFACSVSTKDGTTGVLYNAVLFTGGDRLVVSTDVVNVSVTYSA